MPRLDEILATRERAAVVRQPLEGPLGNLRMPGTMPSVSLPLFPTYQELSQEDPGFEWVKLDPDKEVRLKATLSELRNTEYALRASGTLPMYEELQDQSKPLRWLEPIFDFVSVGNYAMTGFVGELWRSGDWGKALKQSAVEIYNAMPYLEAQSAKRQSWTDILKEQHIFREDTVGRYTAPIVGFALDVLTDPLTWFGAGLLPKALRGTSRGGIKVLEMMGVEGLKTPQTFKEAMALVAEVPLVGGIMDAFGEKFIPMWKHAKLMFAAPEQAEVRALTGEVFDLAQAELAYKSTLTTIRSRQPEVMAAMRDRVFGSLQKMDPLTARLVVAHGADPNLLLSQIKETLTYTRGVGPTVAEMEVVEEAVTAYRELLQEWGREEVRHGLLSSNYLNEFYIPMRAPGTTAQRIEAQQARTILAQTQPVNLLEEVKASPSLSGNIQGMTTETFMHAKEYPTGLERYLAGQPTLVDARAGAMLRGEEYVRATSSVRFREAILANSEIAKRVEDTALLTNREFLSRLDQSGFGLFDGGSISKLSSEELAKSGADELLQYIKKGVYVMPTSLIEEVRRANQILINPDIFSKFIKGVSEVTGLWRAYALFSPGYHLRNLYSNIFQNGVLAGIWNPQYYARSFHLQVASINEVPESVRGWGDQVMAKIGDWTKWSLDDSVKVGKQEMTYRQLYDIAKTKGIIRPGAVMSMEMMGDSWLTSIPKFLDQEKGIHLTPQMIEQKAILRQGGKTFEEAEAITRVVETRRQWWARWHESTPEAWDQLPTATQANAQALDFLQAIRKKDLGQVTKAATAMLWDDLTEIDRRALTSYFKGKPGKGTGPALQRFLAGGEAPTAIAPALRRLRSFLGSIAEGFDQASIKMSTKGGTRSFPIGAEFQDILGKYLGQVRDVGDAALLAGSRTVTAGDKLRLVRDQTGNWVGRNGKLVSVNMYFGSILENNARMAHFLGKIEEFSKRGGEASEVLESAAQSVKKYLFDYDELTEFEQKVMRNIVPFYAWARRNTPLQIQAMIENPGRYANIPKFKAAIESVTEDWKNTTVPDYFSEMYAIRLPLILGQKPVYMNPNFPFQDLNRLNFKDLLGNMAPWLRLPFEIAESESFFRGAPLAAYPGEKGITGLSKVTEHTLAGLIPPFQKTASFLKALTTGGETEAGLNALSQLLGIKLIPVDKGKAVQSQAYARRELVRQLKRKLEDQGIDLSEFKAPKPVKLEMSLPPISAYSPTRRQERRRRQRYGY